MQAPEQKNTQTRYNRHNLQTPPTHPIQFMRILTYDYLCNKSENYRTLLKTTDMHLLSTNRNPVTSSEVLKQFIIVVFLNNFLCAVNEGSPVKKIQKEVGITEDLFLYRIHAHMHLQSQTNLFFFFPPHQD